MLHDVARLPFLLDWMHLGWVSRRVILLLMTRETCELFFLGYKRVVIKVILFTIFLEWPRSKMAWKDVEYNFQYRLHFVQFHLLKIEFHKIVLSKWKICASAVKFVQCTKRWQYMFLKIRENSNLSLAKHRSHIW